jgi:hypothetical protein
VGQLFGYEWSAARRESHPFNWEALSIDGILKGCEQQHSQPNMTEWHADLSAHNISSYLGEIALKNWWWTHPPPQVAQPVEDGMSLC